MAKVKIGCESINLKKNQKLYKSFEKINWKNWGYAIIEK
jgi:hypothetical protein